jgi:capsular polysaccharide biosynthesis protein/Mrp family chromosome partitioning ATPase
MHLSSGASPPGEGQPGRDWGAPADGGAAARVLEAVRSRPLLIAAITLAALVAGFAWASQRAPTYKATAEVLVTPLPDTSVPDPRLPLLRTSSDRTRVIQTATNLIDSTAAAADTARRMGKSWTTDRVNSAIDVQPQGQSDVVAVTAQTGDRGEAARLANTFTRAALRARGNELDPILASLITQAESELRAQSDPSGPLAVELAGRLADLRSLRGHGDPTLSISQAAEPATASSGRSRSLIVLLSLLAGLMVGVGSVLVLDLLGQPRLEEDPRAIAATGLPVLARVSAAALGLPGARLGKPRRRGVAAAFLKLQAELELRQAKPRSVLLAGVTAGDGTTTCAAEYGRALAGLDRDVLLVDADPGRLRLAARLGMTSAAPQSLALGGRHDSGPPLVDVASVPGLKLLMVTEPGTLVSANTATRQRRHVRLDVPAGFDYVIVDTAPVAESLEWLQILPAVDAVVLVVRPTRTRMDDLDTALALLRQTKARVEGLLVISGGRSRRDVGRRLQPATAERATRPVAGDPAEPTAAPDIARRAGPPRRGR